MTGGDGAAPAPEPEWASWPDERLLDLRLCDLGLTIRGELAARIDQLYGELRDHGLRFRPFFWLSDEWYCPDGIPGVAIPFYLAHPRLARLELAHMLEVEGGTPEWCMRLLRHESGHAIENAYRLRLRRRRQKLFGKSSERYRDWYVPRPYSRRFVVHQRNMQFEPRVLVAPVGSTVELPNNDRVFHNVFSFTNGKPFDLGLYPTGASKRITLDRAAVNRLYCNIHPHMAAYIVAVDSPYYASSDRSGSFSIADVPAGRYTYHAWRSGAETLSATVAVGDGQPLEISW